MANELNLSYGTTGLTTVTAQLYAAGAAVGSALSMTEVSGAGGFYTGNLPTTAAGFYAVQFFYGGAVIAAGSINWNGTAEVNSLKIENDVIAIPAALFVDGSTNKLKVNTDNTASVAGSSTALISGLTDAGVAALQAALASRTINVQSPLVITAAGVVVIQIVAGDDYYNADGRAINLPNLNGSWPSWTGAMYTVEFGSLTVSAVPVTSTGSSRSIYFELTSAQTTALAATDNGNGITFDVIVTLANGHRTTVINQAVLSILTNV